MCQRMTPYAFGSHTRMDVWGLVVGLAVSAVRLPVVEACCDPLPAL